jgi:hypothetical protein
MFWQVFQRKSHTDSHTKIIFPFYFRAEGQIQKVASN